MFFRSGKSVCMQQNQQNILFVVIIVSAFLLIPIVIFFSNRGKEPQAQTNAPTELVKNDVDDLGEMKLNVEEKEVMQDNGKMTVQEKTQVTQPEMQIDQNKKYSAVIKTSEGDITIALNAKETPITVNNFVSLAKMGFYDDVIFHRVINGFMIQSGDPLGNGMGGPAYKFADEPFTGEYTRGTVAMANAGPNTNGSQFFIMHEDNALPKNYVIFGSVTNGLETVDKIATAEVKSSPMGERSTPVNPVKIISVEITEE